MSTFFIALPVMVLLTILHSALFSRFDLLGVVPQFIPLVALAWALVRGPLEGYVWAFIAGICIDLFSSSPLGVSPLALMTAVLLITTLQRTIAISRFFIPMILGGIGMFTFSLTTILLLRLSGYPIVWSSVAPLPVSAILHGFLILPLFWVINGLDSRVSKRVQVSG